MEESAITTALTILIYFWTMAIGKKAVSLGQSDPERKSFLWIFGQLANIAIVFGIILVPIIFLELDIVTYLLLSFIPIGVQFFLFKKHFYTDLKKSMELGPDA